MLATLICPQCHMAYQCQPQHAKKRRYCSYACYHASMDTSLPKTCQCCLATYYIEPNRAKGSRYCSNTCRYHPKEVAKRFWDNVDCGPSHACWPWKKYRNPKGYGVASRKGKPQNASRVAYRLTYGEIPDNSLVLHSCDNPVCCNPDHLRLGTHQENMEDRNQKGRQSRLPGEQNPMHKLTTQDVLTIRTVHDTQTLSKSSLARQYNVSLRCIREILKGRTWKHLPLHPGG
jgi:hypothetical protein